MHGHRQTGPAHELHCANMVVPAESAANIIGATLEPNGHNAPSVRLSTHNARIPADQRADGRCRLSAGIRRP
jgi:hypothetical protein